MSYKFIQAPCYLKKDNAGIYEATTDEPVAGKPNVALLIPKMKGNYPKGMFECCVNATSDLADSLRMNMKEYGGTKTEHDINEKLQILVKNMASTLQYIINSTSWRNGTFEEFDKHELQSRLRRFI